jgi:Zn-finger nucleic acid-binding protein
VNCPVDGELLQMSERSGVEIDYCPRCRGVWLDRGELDKIVERADRELSAPLRRYDDDDDDDDRRPDSRYDTRSYDDRERRPEGYPRKKRKNFLSELFEMGGD